MAYRPTQPFNVPLYLLIPEYSTVNGETTLKKYYTEVICLDLTLEKTIVFNMYEISSNGATAKGSVIWNSTGFTYQAPNS